MQQFQKSPKPAEAARPSGIQTRGPQITNFGKLKVTPMKDESFVEVPSRWGWFELAISTSVAVICAHDMFSTWKILHKYNEFTISSVVYGAAFLISAAITLFFGGIMLWFFLGKQTIRINKNFVLVRSELLFLGHTKHLPMQKLSFPYAEQSADMNFFGRTINFAGERKYSVSCDWGDLRHLFCNGLTEPEALMLVEVVAPFFPANSNPANINVSPVDEI